MAASAHQTDAEYVEHFDPPDVLDAKVAQLAAWIRDSHHAIAFTGAGISTSTGIADFRSGMNTVLATGAGAWTLQANNARRTAATKATTKAIPSPAHMTLLAMMHHNAAGRVQPSAAAAPANAKDDSETTSADRVRAASAGGYLKHVISQNTDGLHRRSGIAPAHLSELHGNSNLEVCDTCGHQYLRDGRVRTAATVHEHKTGRLCKAPAGAKSRVCGGALRDTIVNFGENLPAHTLSMAEAQSRTADLCLALGSSLRVQPAAGLPAAVARRGGKLVIVNLQSTPLDGKASLRINAMIDDVLWRLAAHLQLPVWPFVLRRYVRVTCQLAADGGGNASVTSANATQLSVCVEGTDSDGTPATLFQRVEVTLSAPGHTDSQSAKDAPYTFALKVPKVDATKAAAAAAAVDAKKSAADAKSAPAAGAPQVPGAPAAAAAGAGAGAAGAGAGGAGGVDAAAAAVVVDPRRVLVRLTWMGHYNEPDAVITLPFDALLPKRAAGGAGGAAEPAAPAKAQAKPKAGKAAANGKGKAAAGAAKPFACKTGHTTVQHFRLGFQPAVGTWGAAVQYDPVTYTAADAIADNFGLFPDAVADAKATAAKLVADAKAKAATAAADGAGGAAAKPKAPAAAPAAGAGAGDGIAAKAAKALARVLSPLTG